MTREHPTAATMFTQVEVTAGPHGLPALPDAERSEQTRLMREILAAQDRQNELLEELVTQLTSAQRQRNQELAHWKAANPALANNCRVAAEALSRVQTQFLETLTEEVNGNAECLVDGEFLLNEFVDRFGPRLAHLNGVLQVLVQLSSPSA